MAHATMGHIRCANSAMGRRPMACTVIRLASSKNMQQLLPRSVVPHCSPRGQVSLQVQDVDAKEATGEQQLLGLESSQAEVVEASYILEDHGVQPYAAMQSMEFISPVLDLQPTSKSPNTNVSKATGRNFEAMPADLPTVLTSVLFVTGVIMVEYGVQEMLDYYLGDSIMGSISCIAVGLSMVLYIRLKGWKIANFYQI